MYVVVPLRAMATYQNAVQSMGRGLWLPAGHRVEDSEVDTLDVLCFGKETFEEIMQQATKQFGRGPDGAAAIGIADPHQDEDRSDLTKRITIGTQQRVTFEIPNVRRIHPEPDLDFEIAKAPSLQIVSGIDIVSLDRIAAEEDFLRYNAETTVVRNAVLRVIADLPYLSPAIGGKACARLTSPTRCKAR